MIWATALVAFLSSQATPAYSFTAPISPRSGGRCCTEVFGKSKSDHSSFAAQSLLASVVVGAFTVVAPVQHAFADEIGISIDAPTLFTGRRLRSASSAVLLESAKRPRYGRWRTT